MSEGWYVRAVRSLLKSVFALALGLCICIVLDWDFPHGLEEAFSLIGIFAAATCATLSFARVKMEAPTPLRDIIAGGYFLLFSSILIAHISALGGGVLRRLITQSENGVQPSWWITALVAWILAQLALANTPSFAHRRMLPVSIAFDSWALGVFAVAGMVAALEWNSAFLGSVADKTILSQLLIVGLFAALTGAGGGLVAEAFARATYNFRSIREVLGSVLWWWLKEGTVIAGGLGIWAYVIFRLLDFGLPLIGILPTVTKIGIKVRQLASMASTDGMSTIFNHIVPLLFTRAGIIVMTYICFGFASCYLLRGARPEPIDRQSG